MSELSIQMGSTIESNGNQGPVKTHFRLIDKKHDYSPIVFGKQKKINPKSIVNPANTVEWFIKNVDEIIDTLHQMSIVLGKVYNGNEDKFRREQLISQRLVEVFPSLQIIENEMSDFLRMDSFVSDTISSKLIQDWHPHSQKKNGNGFRKTKKIPFANKKGESQCRFEGRFPQFLMISTIPSKFGIGEYGAAILPIDRTFIENHRTSGAKSGTADILIRHFHCSYGKVVFLDRREIDFNKILQIKRESKLVELHRLLSLIEEEECHPNISRCSNTQEAKAS